MGGSPLAGQMAAQQEFRLTRHQGSLRASQRTAACRRCWRAVLCVRPASFRDGSCSVFLARRRCPVSFRTTVRSSCRARHSRRREALRGWLGLAPLPGRFVMATTPAVKARIWARNPLPAQLSARKPTWETPWDRPWRHLHTHIGFAKAMPEHRNTFPESPCRESA